MAAGQAAIEKDGAIIIIAGRSRDLSMAESGNRQAKETLDDLLGQYDLNAIHKGDGGLQGSIDDLYLMDHFLKSRNVSVYEVVTLTQGEQLNVKDVVMCKIQNLFNSPRLGFVIYFSGHGNDNGDWVLGRSCVLKFNDVCTAFLSRHCPPAIGDCAQQKLLVIADSCRSGRWVQQLEGKQRLQGAPPDAHNIFIQAACGPEKDTLDYERGGLFTRLFTDACSDELHNGTGMAGPQSAEEKSMEDMMVSRLNGQVPHASIAASGFTFVLNIGKGIGLTKCWITMLRKGVSQSRPTPTVPSGVAGTTEDTGDFPEDLADDISKGFNNLDQVYDLAIYLKVGSDFVDELDERRGMTNSLRAFKVLKEFCGRTPSNRMAGEKIYDILWNKLKKRRLAAKYEGRLKGFVE